MIETEELFALLEQALHNTQKGMSVQHAFSPDLALLGEEGALDSLDTMIFLGEVDTLLSNRLGREVEVVNAEGFAQEEGSPFRSMQSLADYIMKLLREQEEYL